MVLTRLSITETWQGVARLTSKSTFLVWKQNKVNHAHIRLNVLIAKVSTWLMITNACFGDIDSTENGTQKKPRKPEKSELTQSALL